MIRAESSSENLGAPVLLGVIRIGAKGSGGSSNLELYTTQPSSSLSPRRTTGNRVVVLLLVLLWPRGKKKNYILH